MVQLNMFLAVRLRLRSFKVFKSSGYGSFRIKKFFYFSAINPNYSEDDQR